MADKQRSASQSEKILSLSMILENRVSPEMHKMARDVLAAKASLIPAIKEIDKALVQLGKAVGGDLLDLRPGRPQQFRALESYLKTVTRQLPEAAKALEQFRTRYVKVLQVTQKQASPGTSAFLLKSTDNIKKHTQLLKELHTEYERGQKILAASGRLDVVRGRTLGFEASPETLRVLKAIAAGAGPGKKQYISEVTEALTAVSDTLKRLAPARSEAREIRNRTLQLTKAQTNELAAAEEEARARTYAWREVIATSRARRAEAWDAMQLHAVMQGQASRIPARMEGHIEMAAIERSHRRAAGRYERQFYVQDGDTYKLLEDKFKALQEREARMPNAFAKMLENVLQQAPASSRLLRGGTVVAGQPQPYKAPIVNLPKPSRALTDQLRAETYQQIMRTLAGQMDTIGRAASDLEGLLNKGLWQHDARRLDRATGELVRIDPDPAAIDRKAIGDLANELQNQVSGFFEAKKFLGEHDPAFLRTMDAGVERFFSDLGDRLAPIYSQISEGLKALKPLSQYIEGATAQQKFDLLPRSSATGQWSADSVTQEMGFIYQIRNMITGKEYYGQAKSFDRRMIQHATEVVKAIGEMAEGVKPDQVDAIRKVDPSFGNFYEQLAREGGLGAAQARVMASNVPVGPVMNELENLMIRVARSIETGYNTTRPVRSQFFADKMLDVFQQTGMLPGGSTDPGRKTFESEAPGSLISRLKNALVGPSLEAELVKEHKARQKIIEFTANELGEEWGSFLKRTMAHAAPMLELWSREQRATGTLKYLDPVNLTPGGHTRLPALSGAEYIGRASAGVPRSLPPPTQMRTVPQLRQGIEFLANTLQEIRDSWGQSIIKHRRDEATGRGKPPLRVEVSNLDLAMRGQRLEMAKDAMEKLEAERHEAARLAGPDNQFRWLNRLNETLRTAFIRRKEFGLPTDTSWMRDFHSKTIGSLSALTSNLYKVVEKFRTHPQLKGVPEAQVVSSYYDRELKGTDPRVAQAKRIAAKIGSVDPSQLAGPAYHNFQQILEEAKKDVSSMDQVERELDKLAAKTHKSSQRWNRIKARFVDTLKAGREGFRKMLERAGPKPGESIGAIMRRQEQGLPDYETVRSGVDPTRGASGAAKRVQEDLNNAEKIFDKAEATAKKNRSTWQRIKSWYRDYSRPQYDVINPDGSLAAGGRGGGGGDRRNMQQMRDENYRYYTTIAGGFVGLSAVMYKTVDAGYSFDRAMKQVQARSGATAEEMKGLTDQAEHLGRTTIRTATEAAQSQAILAAAGFKVTEIQQSVATVLGLATLGQISLSKSAEVSAGTLRGFNLEAGQMVRVGDVLAHVYSNFDTTIEQAGTAMSYAAPVAYQLGVSLEETATMIGILSNRQIKGTRAGTAIRTSLLRLMAPTSRASEMMEQLNISTRDSNGRFVGMSTILQELEPHLKNTGFMAELFGKRHVAAMNILVHQGADELRRLTLEAILAGGTLDQQSAIIHEGFAASLDRVKSITTGVHIDLAQGMTPAIKGMAAALSVLPPGIQHLVVLSAEVTASILAFALFTGRTKYLGMAFDGLKNRMGGVINSVGVFRRGIPPLLAGLKRLGIAGAVVGTVMAAFYIYKNRNEMKQRNQDLEETKEKLYGIAASGDVATAKFRELYSTQLALARTDTAIENIAESYDPTAFMTSFDRYMDVKASALIEQRQQLQQYIDALITGDVSQLSEALQNRFNMWEGLMGQGMDEIQATQIANEYWQAIEGGDRDAIARLNDQINEWVNNVNRSGEAADENAEKVMAYIGGLLNARTELDNAKFKGLSEVLAIDPIQVSENVSTILDELARLERSGRDTDQLNKLVHHAYLEYGREGREFQNAARDIFGLGDGTGTTRFTIFKDLIDEGKQTGVLLRGVEKLITMGEELRDVYNIDPGLIQPYLTELEMLQRELDDTVESADAVIDKFAQFRREVLNLATPEQREELQWMDRLIEATPETGAIQQVDLLREKLEEYRHLTDVVDILKQLDDALDLKSSTNILPSTAIGGLMTGITQVPTAGQIGSLIPNIQNYELTRQMMPPDYLAKVRAAEEQDIVDAKNDAMQEMIEKYRGISQGLTEAGQAIGGFSGAALSATGQLVNAIGQFKGGGSKWGFAGGLVGLGISLVGGIVSHFKGKNEEEQRYIEQKRQERIQEAESRRQFFGLPDRSQIHREAGWVKSATGAELESFASSRGLQAWLQSLREADLSLWANQTAIHGVIDELDALSERYNKLKALQSQVSDALLPDTEFGASSKTYDNYISILQQAERAGIELTDSQREAAEQLKSLSRQMERLESAQQMAEDLLEPVSAFADSHRTADAYVATLRAAELAGVEITQEMIDIIPQLRQWSEQLQHTVSAQELVKDMLGPQTTFGDSTLTIQNFISALTQAEQGGLELTQAQIDSVEKLREWQKQLDKVTEASEFIAGVLESQRQFGPKNKTYENYIKALDMAERAGITLSDEQLAAADKIKAWSEQLDKLRAVQDAVTEALKPQSEFGPQHKTYDNYVRILGLAQAAGIEITQAQIDAAEQIRKWSDKLKSLQNVNDQIENILKDRVVGKSRKTYDNYIRVLEQAEDAGIQLTSAQLEAVDQLKSWSEQIQKLEAAQKLAEDLLRPTRTFEEGHKTYQNFIRALDAAEAAGVELKQEWIDAAKAAKEFEDKFGELRSLIDEITGDIDKQTYSNYERVLDLARKSGIELTSAQTDAADKLKTYAAEISNLTNLQRQLQGDLRGQKYLDFLKDFGDKDLLSEYQKLLAVDLSKVEGAKSFFNLAELESTHLNKIKAAQKGVNAADHWRTLVEATGLDSTKLADQLFGKITRHPGQENEWQGPNVEAFKSIADLFRLASTHQVALPGELQDLFTYFQNRGFHTGESPTFEPVAPTIQEQIANLGEIIAERIAAVQVESQALIVEQLGLITTQLGESLGTNNQLLIQAIETYMPQVHAAITAKLEEVRQSSEALIVAQLSALQASNKVEIDELETNIITSFDLNLGKILTETLTVNIPGLSEEFDDLETAIEALETAIETEFDTHLQELKTALDTEGTELKTTIETELRAQTTQLGLDLDTHANKLNTMMNNVIHRHIVRLSTDIARYMQHVRYRMNTIFDREVGELKIVIDRELQNTQDAIVGKLEEIRVLLATVPDRTADRRGDPPDQGGYRRGPGGGQIGDNYFVPSGAPPLNRPGTGTITFTPEDIGQMLRDAAPRGDVILEQDGRETARIIAPWLHEGIEDVGIS